MTADQRNNPLNLRPLGKGQWPGQTDVNGGFAVFGDPQSGWNAADQNILASVNEHGSKSLNDIVGRWAPASDNNNPAAYAARVAKEVGVQPGDDISQRLTTDADFRHSVLGSMAGVETGKAQTFGGAPAQDGTAFGLSPQEVAQLKFGPAASAPGANQPGSKAQFNFGPGFGALSAAAVPTYQKILAERNAGDSNAMRNADVGSPQLPYYVTPGTAAPNYPGQHWVDANGLEHVNPGGLAEKVGMAFENLAQGAGVDTAASGARLGLGAGDPVLGALAQSQGGPSAFENYQAVNQAFQQQGRDFKIRHLGDRKSVV